MLLWIYNAPVTITSTVYPLTSSAIEVKKTRRKSGLKSADASATRAEMGPDNVETEEDVPLAIHDYGQHIEEAGIAYQLHGHYNLQLPTCRKWFPMFF